MIAVDWGSSSLRAWRVADGGIVEQRRAATGALACGERHADVLGELIAGWDDRRLLVCGMAGARGGWREAAYVDCPADAARIAAALLPVETTGTVLHGRDVHIVPGVADLSASVADVMRGEETQILGLPHARESGHSVVCLPGTHSKWVIVRDGAIASLRTLMTGEAFSLFRTHSVLARSLDAADGAFDDDAFAAGVRRSGDSGGLLHHLFGIRAQSLFGRLSPSAAPSYLSGLLIGHEVRCQLPLPAPLHLVGSETLTRRYRRALALLGVDAAVHGEELAVAGLCRLAQVAGLR